MDRSKMRRQWERVRSGLLKAGLTALLGVSIGVGQSAAQQDVPLETLVRDADTIAYGRVTQNETKWIGNHLETTTHIEVGRYLKGDRGSDLTLTQPGGTITRPIPITQRVTNSTNFQEGEQVVVFLSEQPERSEEMKNQMDPNSGLLSTPVLVGGPQGKVSVVTDPDNGAEKIATYREAGLSTFEINQARRAVEEQQERMKETGANRAAGQQAAENAATQSAAPSGKPTPLPSKAEKIKADMKEPVGYKNPAPVDISQVTGDKAPMREVQVNVHQQEQVASAFAHLEGFSNYMSRVEGLVQSLSDQKPAYAKPVSIHTGGVR